MAKNKMKSHRGAMKRFKLTGTGKVKRHKAFKSHKATSKTPKRKMALRQSTILGRADHKRIKSVLYGR
ncbi:MAG TPA: 50S ribosomal protein L35 [Bacillota bacterium]|nr:50S ribosomal protein L35 [Bacillota bacterium]HQC35672.1 50S ribosomal protein L35 [Bacillota bacterium]